MAKVFVTRKLPQVVLDRLSNAKQVSEVRVHDVRRVIERPQLLKNVEWCDCLLSQLTDKIDQEVLEKNPALKIVANYAVGYNNIDVKTASKLKIPVTNTPGVLDDTTADLTFGLLLATARRIVEADEFMRSGKYTETNWDPLLMTGHDIHHKTLGIVGLGRIGQAVARRAKGFDMKIVYTSSNGKEKAEAKDIGAELVTLDTLLEQSDFVSLHTPLNENTKHLINEARLKQMKSSAILINASRGPCVDEAALVRALKSGTIAGAGLDVFEQEPVMEKDLASLKNAVILPHIGSASIDTRVNMGNAAVSNILARLDGAPLPSCVNGSDIGL